jgi:hypothetical protein
MKAEHYVWRRSVPGFGRISTVIAKLKFVAAELQKAQRLETKREREQAPPEETR